jgi:hypothetical protein
MRCSPLFTTVIDKAGDFHSTEGIQLVVGILNNRLRFKIGIYGRILNLILTVVTVKPELPHVLSTAIR